MVSVSDNSSALIELKPDFNIHLRHQKENKEKEYMILAKSFISPDMLIAFALMAMIQETVY